MAPYVTRPGETPREVQIERKRRLYALQDMEDMLKERSVPVCLSMRSTVLPLVCILHETLT